MKKITLKQNDTFEHQWIAGLHKMPAEAIDVTDAVFMQLSQNPQSKKYDPVTKIVSDYVPPFNLTNTINAKMGEINTAASAALASITNQYTRMEIDSWPTQEAEALTWQADNTAITPLLDGMVANRAGMDKPTLVAKVLGNAAVFKAISGAVIGKKQGYEDQVAALAPTATQTDIDSIVVAF